MIETALLALTVFASTNIDDAFVLLAFFGDPRFRGRDVVIGQYAGMTALTLLAIAFAALSFAVPDRYIGLMGLLPVLIGVFRLWGAWREQKSGGGQQVEDVKIGPLGGVAAVALVTIANGADNIAVYVPLFARASIGAIGLTCAVFAVMVAVWCLAAQMLIRHRQFGAIVQAWGKLVTPFVLIALGAYIIVRSGVLSYWLSVAP